LVCTKPIDLKKCDYYHLCFGIAATKAPKVEKFWNTHVIEGYLISSKYATVLWFVLEMQYNGKTSE
jgi:hypothetical protein